MTEPLLLEPGRISTVQGTPREGEAYMSSIAPDQQLKELEEKSVKYAIVVEARDAVHAYLKYWAGFIGALAIIGGWLGVSLHTQLDALNTIVASQKERVADLDTRAKELLQTVSTTEANVNELKKNVTVQERYLDDKERALGSKADRLYDRAGHFEEMAIQYGAKTDETLQRIATAANESEKQAAEAKAEVAGINKMRGDVETAATSARDDGKALSTIMNRAHEFDNDIGTHRRVFRNALLDYFTLTSKADSPELRLTSGNGAAFYKVTFHTGRNISSGFTLSYDVTECKLPSEACGAPTHHDKVIHFTRSHRDWVDIDGTYGQYEFAVDYVFVSAFAKNFVTIRVGATDKLLPSANTSDVAVRASLQ
jgi:cell division protein FtsB